MKRILLTVAAIALTGLLAAGCDAGGAKQSVQPPTGGGDAAPVAATPEPAPSRVTAGTPVEKPAASPVSSEIAAVKYPWVKAPVAVTLFTGDLVIRFSGPVSRQSVEKRLVTEQNGVKVTWRSDTEAAISVPGCSFNTFSVTGGKDAEGRELTAELNPAFQLRYPCHGGGYTFLRLGEQKAIEGWPYEAPVQDIDTGRGVGIGSLGGMLFRYDFATGSVEPLMTANRPAIARFVTGGNLLVAEPGTVRVVDLSGQVLREFAVLGSPGAVTVAAGGTEALAFMLTGEGKGMAYLLDLTEGTARNLGRIDLQGDLPTAAWRYNTREVAFLDFGKVVVVLNVDTGKTVAVAETGAFPSPDGKWVAVQKPAALRAAGTDQPVVMLKEGRPLDQTVPVWSPDSRYVLMTTGELVDLSARRVVEDLYFDGCGPVFPDRIWTMGEAVYLTFSRNCY